MDTSIIQKNIILTVFWCCLFILYPSYGHCSQSDSLNRIYQLNQVILMRSGSIIRYAQILPKSKERLTEEDIKALYGSLILSATIHHIHTMTSFSTALIALHEDGLQYNKYSAKKTKFIFDTYRKQSFLAESAFIISTLEGLVKKFPEPVLTNSKDTLRDFLEYKDIILNYKK